MRITLFTDVRALIKEEREFTQSELVALIQSTIAPAKHDLPLLKLATFGEKRTPQKENGRGGNSIRHDENVLEVTGIETDYDGEIVTFEEAVDSVKELGLTAILYTSPSYTPAKPRWRALFPLSTPISPQERSALADRANAVFNGALSGGKESWVLSQSFYFGKASDHFLLESFETALHLDQLDTLPGIPFGSEDLRHDQSNQAPTTDSSTPGSVDDLPPQVRRVIKSGDIKKFSFKSRNHMVFYVACSLVRAGWEDEAIAALLIDPNYSFTAHVREQGNPRLYARKQARDARTKSQEDWERGPRNVISVLSQRNIERALDEIGAKFHRDVFIERNYVNGAGQLREVSDHEMSSLRLTVDRKFNFLPSKDLFYDVVENLAYSAQTHPLRTRLATLEPTWDHTERLGCVPTRHPTTNDIIALGTPSWLTTYGGAEDTVLTRRIGRLVLIAAVRRARQPGCEFQEMLVMVNPQQGTNKSGAVKALSLEPSWYTDSLPLYASDQKVIEQLRGRWLVECADLHGFKKADVEHLKSFLSRTADRSRLAYGRQPVEAPRQCIFIGTTNTVEFLRDVQNRRFWPVHVNRFDIEALRNDAEQLWAEAAQAETNGETIRLEEEYWEAATLTQWVHRQNDPWAEILHEVLKDIKGKITFNDAFRLIGRPGERRQQDDNVRLGEALRELGFERRKARTYGRLSWCYVRGDTSNEREAQIYVISDPLDNNRFYAGNSINGDIEPRTAYDTDTLDGPNGPLFFTFDNAQPPETLC